MKIIIQSWLRYAAVMLLVLTGGLSAMAQTEGIEGGEAFYIYQNDGHFDGFFYDQVKEIRYSRFDTLGIERSEYVSQEIVTEDSVYRIMLTAIDSVSYVQPEIRFAKGVRFMRDEGLMAYYVSMSQTGDGFLLQFNSGLPTALQPKKNEVLSCPDLPDYDEMFVGKVKSVRNEGGKLVVECGYIDDIKEVFDQFVTVEQVRNVQTVDGSRTYRRMAGLNTPRRVEGNYTDITLFNFTYAHEWSGFKLTDNLTLGLALNIGFGMQATAVYKIRWGEFYVKTVLKDQVSLGATVSLDGELYAKSDLTMLPGVGALLDRFSKVPFPASFPILYVNLTPKPFTDVQAHLNVSVGIGGEVKGTAFMLELKDKWPYVDMGVNFIAPFLPYNLEAEGTFNINAQLNGSVYSGIKFPIESGTEEWIKKICGLKAEMSVSAGPKVSGALNFDILKAPFGAYEALKGSKVDLTLMSITTEASGDVTVFGKEGKHKVSHSWDFGNYPLALLASVDDMTTEITGDNEDGLKCHYEVSGDVCFPQKLGVGLYVKENENDIYYKKLYQSKLRDELYFLNTFNSVDVEFKDIPPGEYRARPLIAGPGLIPVIEKEHIVYIAAKDIELKPEEGIFDEAGGEMEVTLVSQQTMPITATSDKDWITTDITLPDGKGGYGVMVVKVAENNTDAYRTGTVTVRQRYSTSEYKEKTFTVKQYGGLQLSPAKLNFTKDGGAETVEILTSMRPITINLNGAENWIGYELDGNKLYLTVKPNTGAPRTASITVSAWSSRHNGINAKTLTITQQGEDTSVPHVSPTSLSYSAKGGMQSVQAYVGNVYNRVGYAVGNDCKSWISVANYEDYHLEITAKPNTTGAERTGTVTVYMAAFEGDSPAPGTEMATFPITITQAGGGIAVTSCALSASATMREKTSGGISTNSYGETFTSPNVSVTLNGTKLHVVATKNYKEGEYDDYQNVMEFDITAIGNDFAGSKVENLSFRHIYTNHYVDFTSPGTYGKGDDVALQLTNLSVKESESTYKEGEKSTIVFSGKVSDGVKFSKLTQKTYNYTDNKPTKEFSYVDSESNSARLVIELTVDREALSGLSNSRQTSDSGSMGAITW